MIPISKLKPVDLIPFRLQNIEPFIQRDHPVINPFLEEVRYFEYWEEFAMKCMQGMWGEDRNRKTGEGGWRFMTNDLFFYVNAFWIEMQQLSVDPNEVSRSGVLAHPTLRDIDWYMFYGFEESDGFSGFEDDKKFTSHDLVRKLETKEPLLQREKIVLKQYEDFLKTPDNKWKKYIGPKEYLYKTFDKPMGKAMHLNEKKDFLYLTTRRLGKSYHGISLAKRGFVFNDATNLQDYYKKNTNFISVFGAWEDKPTKENFRKLGRSYDMLKELGAYRDDLRSYNGVFWFPKSGSEDLNKGISNRVKAEGGKHSVGAGSVMGRVSYGKNISSGVGYAGNYYWNEEVGLWENVEGVHKENSPAQIRETKFGRSIYGGTGGQLKKVKNVRKPFYNPRSMNLVEYPDIYNMTGRSIACFVPAQYRQNWHRDENGNLDHIAAFQDELMVRKKEIDKGGSVAIKHVASFPMTHADIFMQSSSGNLPVERASQRLSILQSIPDEEKNIKVGTLHWDGDSNRMKVFFSEDNDLPIIKTLEELESASDDIKKKPIVTIYEPPILDGKSLYFGTYDNVRYDEGNSWAIAYIFKVYGPPKTMKMNIVARVLCRMTKREMNDKEALKLVMFYECNMLPETNIPSVISNAELWNLEHLLMPCPLQAYRTIANVTAKHDVGWYTTPGTKSGLEVLASEYLNTLVDQIVSEEGITDVLMVDEIRDELLLDTIIFYSKDGNFDPMSAFFGISLQLKQWTLEGGWNQKPTQGNSAGKSLIAALASAKVQTNRAFNY
jgi:hypothetical protein